MRIGDMLYKVLDHIHRYGFYTEVHFGGSRKFHFDLDARVNDYDGNSELAIIPDD